MSRRLPIPGVVAVVCLVAAAAAGGLWWINHSNDTDESPESSSGPVTVLVSGDTAGWIVPCGCASNQSGGLLRRGTYVAAEREKGPVVYADAGGAPAGTEPYQRAKFEAILRGELAMQVAAHNIGGPEAKLGAEYLRQVGRKLSVPFVSANLRDADGRPVAEGYRIVETAGGRIALFGVLSTEYAEGELSITDPRQAVLESLDAVKQKCSAVVVLAYLPEAELRRLAASLPEVDVIVGGPTGQSIAPVRTGPTLLASATNKGKFLVRLQRAADASGSPSWSGQSVEITSEFADDPRQKANLDSFYAKLAERDFTAEESGFVPVLTGGLPADYRVSGTQSCFECHAEDCEVWESSGHAHAWQRLAESGAQVDSYCQQCHTTGFGLPGGFVSARRSPGHVSVGCESCHGPSYQHVQLPSRKTPYLAQDRCISCHDRENSPEFDYDDYWTLIEHGNPAESTTSGNSAILEAP